jgi:DNA-binding FadR family transcriptional regulator
LAQDLLSSLTRQVLFAPLKPSGRTEAVVDRLRTAIALGVLAEGEQLPSESELAGQFNVSPVTLREALGVLRAEGIVETRRGRGGGSFVRVPDQMHIAHGITRLAAMSPVDLRDLADWRCAVSATAAYLAAERASDQNVATLFATADRLTDAANEVAARRADARFHIELAAAAQSARLSGEAISLQIEYAPLLTPVYRDPDARKAAAERFVSIAGCIQDGQAEQARKLTQAAIAATRDLLLALRLDMARTEAEEPSS